MSKSTSKAVFNQIRNDFRTELENLNQLLGVLLSKINEKTPDPETRTWITDVFIDSLQQLEVKFVRIVKELTPDVSHRHFRDIVANCIHYAEQVAFSIDLPVLTQNKVYLKSYTELVMQRAEEVFVKIQGVLWHSDWKGIEKIKPIDFLSSERIKYVSARESIQKARACLDGNIEDVLMHLRPAIDLSIKERFGFTKIQPMKTFLKDADKMDFQLPSYSLIYNIFDEGSNRIHEGKAGTPFEARELISVVSHFVDALETVNVSKEKIEEFKNKCSAVE